MDLMDYRRKIIASSPHLNHAEGAVASFPDGTDLPLKSLVVNIDPVQSGSGDPSPSNIRPISGWDAVGVTRTGKNLLGGYTLGQAIVNAVGNTSYSKFASDSTGDYVTITASSYTSRKVFTSGVKFKSNTQYTIILKITRNAVGPSLSSNINVAYTDGTSKVIVFSESTEAEIVTVIFVTNATKTVKTIETAWGGGTSKIYYDECGIFEGVLTADGFEPYTGTSLTVQLGRTVYGGTLNVLSGELVVDRYVVDPSQWTQYNASNGYKAYRNKNVPKAVGVSNTVNKPLSNIVSEFGTFSSSSMNKNIIQPPYPANSGNDAYMALEDGIDPTSVEFSYILQEPITIQLTPNQVNSLLGVNNIWADTGNTSLDYWAHP